MRQNFDNLRVIVKKIQKKYPELSEERNLGIISVVLKEKDKNLSEEFEVALKRVNDSCEPIDLGKGTAIIDTGRNTWQEFEK